MWKKKLDITQYAYLVMAFGIVIFCALVLLGFKIALASDLNVLTSYHQANSSFNRQKYTQTIDAGQLSSLTGNSIDIYMTACNVASGNDFSLYENGSLLFFLGNENCTNGSTTIRFPDTIEFSNSNTYYFEFEDANSATSTPQNNSIGYESGVDTINGVLSGTNYYTDDYSFSAANGEDARFQIYYDFDYIASSTEQSTYDDYDVSVVELDEPDVFVQVGNESLSMYNVDCLITEPCYLTLNYSFSDIGENVVIYEVNSDGTNSRNATTTTLTNNLFLKHKVLLEDQADGTIKYYKAYIISDLSPSNISKVIWWNEVDYLDEEYVIGDACSDMATTTWEAWNPTTWAGGMGYAMECAFRKTMFWAFTPYPSTYVKLENAKEDIMQEFPFNIMYVGKALVEIASSSATSTWSIPVNWIASGSAPTSTLATLSFSNDVVQSDYGVLWEKFMLMQTIVFYLFGFGVIFILALKILKIGSNKELE